MTESRITIFCQGDTSTISYRLGFCNSESTIKNRISRWRSQISTKHYTIERKDVLEDIDFLLQAEIKFWQCVENRNKTEFDIADDMKKEV